MEAAQPQAPVATPAPKAAAAVSEPPQLRRSESIFDLAVRGRALLALKGDRIMLGVHTNEHG